MIRGFSLSKKYVYAKIKVSVKPFQRLAVSKGRAFVSSAVCKANLCAEYEIFYTLGAPQG